MFWLTSSFLNCPCPPEATRSPWCPSQKYGSVHRLAQNRDVSLDYRFRLDPCTSIPRSWNLSLAGVLDPPQPPLCYPNFWKEITRHPLTLDGFGEQEWHQYPWNKKVIFLTSCGILPIRIPVPRLIPVIKAVMLKIRAHFPKGCAQQGRACVKAQYLKVKSGMKERTEKHSVDEETGGMEAAKKEVG